MPKDIPFGDSLTSLLRLSMLPGLGPRTLAELLRHFPSADAVLGASHNALQEVPGVGPKLVHAIMHADLHVDVQGLIEDCEKLAIEIVPQGAPRYPSRLLEIDDPPPVLFMRGSIIPEDALAIGLVGTRRPTAYGVRQTERIAAGLAHAGVTVISGLARGIDGRAHQGTLAAGGRTIAVLGGGLGAIYPAEHEGMARAIQSSGAVISEQPPWVKPRGGMFPQRNRLISGLSLGVCVLEAGDRSGALITARLAGEQGRDCFALPGAVSSRMSRGTNQLIRDGATLIRSADDILELLGPLSEPVWVRDQDDQPQQLRHLGELQLNEQERRVLASIECESTSIDVVVATSGLSVHRVLATISVLEMRRLVRRLSGQYVARI